MSEDERESVRDIKREGKSVRAAERRSVGSRRKGGGNRGMDVDGWGEGEGVNK